MKVQVLKKAVVPGSVIEHPSPGNLQSTRLALHVDENNGCWIYLASASRIYRLLVSRNYEYAPPLSYDHLSYHHLQIPLENSSINLGKDDLLIPQHSQLLEASLLNRCPHPSEIQSIVLAPTQSASSLILGTVDSYAHLIVSTLDANGKDVDRLTYSVPPRDHGVGEGSWAGLCFNPTQWSMAAVAHGFSKAIDVYDQDIHVRTLRTLWYPSSTIFMQSLSGVGDTSMLAIAEGCQLSIWDLRMSEKGGCVRRICGSVGDILYSVCNSSNGNIAAGGADRTVTVYDPRRWSAVSRWLNCTKYEITGLAFSTIDPEYIYVQGVDYEVLCGRWRESKKTFSYRGDSNWLGFSKCSDRDVLGGWCDSGSIFVADVHGVDAVDMIPRVLDVSDAATF